RRTRPQSVKSEAQFAFTRAPLSPVADSAARSEHQGGGLGAASDLPCQLRGETHVVRRPQRLETCLLALREGQSLDEGCERCGVDRAAPGELLRSEERRVGKECRARREPCDGKK